jgi:hypothetical protein
LDKISDLQEVRTLYENLNFWSKLPLII